jgi:hypothetical protein
MKSANKQVNRNIVHTPKSPKGLGDYYGTGIVAKLGRMREDSMGMVTMTPQKLKTPPKSVV